MKELQAWAAAIRRSTEGAFFGKTEVIEQAVFSAHVLPGARVTAYLRALRALRRDAGSA